MKHPMRIFLASIAITGLLAACTLGPQVDQTDAINTAVVGTQQAQALGQATVNAAVLTSMPATPTPGPTVEYVTMTEEELAALIDEAVTEAVAATEATTTAVTTTTYDDAVTTEEVAYIYEYYYYADYYVEYAEELLAQYYALYGELAYEMITEMTAIQAELSQMNSTLSSIDQSLQEISVTLAQGLALAEESIAQLEAAAQQAQTNAQALKNQAQDMMAVLQTDQQNRMDQLAQIQPNNIPTDRLSALQSGFAFIDAAQAALGDNKLSRDELLNIAQLGANAQAGFANFGGRGGAGPGADLDLSQFSGKFGEITTQFARGQVPQGRANLDGFERSLGTRPSGSGLPGGGLPGGGGGAPGPRP
ncbi:MAG: hypothetical protein C4583_15900 [Anaerolineaceae bacterium]|nr:MAG: hypothetical protein C4583_15900 [Anaerolineaceae bacterium]